MGLLTLYQPFHPFLEGDLDLVITVIEYGLISSGLFLTSFITCNLLKIKISRYFNRIALYTLLLSLITFILGFRKHQLPRKGEPFCRILVPAFCYQIFYASRFRYLDQRFFLEQFIIRSCTTELISVFSPILLTMSGIEPL